MRKTQFATALLAASLLAIGLVPTTARATTLDISLGDQSANFELLLRSASLGVGGTNAGIGLFFNEDDDFVVHGRWLGVNARPTPTSALSFTAGVKAYFGELGEVDESLSGVAVGGGVSLLRPSPTMPLSFGVEGYYAPQITSFGDAESILEVSLRLEVDLMPTTRAYVGYRLMEAEFENSSETVELDGAVHFGVRMDLD